MPIRNTTHILKNSDIIARPLPSTLLKGEAIVNTADGIMFFSGVTTSTSGWTQSGPSTPTFFEVGSNLYDLKLRNKIVSYSGLTDLSGKFLSGTTSGFVLADVSSIVGVDTFTTGFTYSNNVATIQRNQGQPDLSILIDTMTGLTVNGILSATTGNFDTSNVNTLNATAGTITTLGSTIINTNNLNVTGSEVVNNLTITGTGLYNTTPSGTNPNEIVNYGSLTAYTSANDTFVTGGTMSSGGTLSLNRNDSVSVSIPNVSFWTSGTSGNFSIKAINDSAIDASADYSHAEGNGTLAAGESSHAEGRETTASAESSHAEGNQTTASGDFSHAEGDRTTAIQEGSHSEGVLTTASGIASHSEGRSTTASGEASHAEGRGTIASGSRSHAEGSFTTASGVYSHSEGELTIASGRSSHAGGYQSIASGVNSFVHGSGSTASGTGTIVLGNNITGTTDNMTYVGSLNINSVPTLNNSNTQILSRNDSTGNVEYTPLSAISSTDTYVTGFTYTPASNTLTIKQNQGQPDLTAQINSVSGLSVSNLTAGRVVYVGTAGLLTDESGFEYNDGTNTLAVNNINANGDVIVQGSLTVFGPSISAFTSQLYVEDPNVIFNYNPTGSTTVTSVNAGLTIQDGSGVSGSSVQFDIVRMQNLTGLTVNQIPSVTEYSGPTGYPNRGWITQLNDIVIRSTNATDGGVAGDINGVRVLCEWDTLDGGQY